MIRLNDAAIEYMHRLGYTDIVLLTDDDKTWCDPSRREVFVSFTDDPADEYGDEYIHESSQIGAVFIPRHGIVVGENAAIRYERRPWIEHFEFDDIRPAEVCCLWTPK